jgi:hypothetical protein
MRRFFHLLLTGKDNETYDITRFLLLIGFVSLILFAGWDVFASGHLFDPIGYSMGLTGLLFGGSSGIAVKARTEPDRSDAFENPEGIDDPR